MIAWFKNLFKKKQIKHEWGGTKLLFETPYVKITYIWVDAGRATELFTSQDLSMKNWLFLKGSGDYTISNMKKKILPGTNPLITSGVKHSIQATNEKVEVIEIQYGNPVSQTLQLESGNDTKTPQLPSA